jgi:hypothetical protein
MEEEKQNQTCLVCGLLVALAANIAAAGITIWENKTLTEEDLWASSTYLVTVGGAAILAFALGLPLNLIALVFFWKKENWSKVMLAMSGACLSLLPWVMPIIVEHFVFGW